MSTAGQRHPGWWHWFGARLQSSRERRTTAQQWQVGYVIRADMPDGTHFFSTCSPAMDTAVRQAARIRQSCLSRLGIIPNLTLVHANQDLVTRHRDDCRSTTCPNG